MLSSPSRSPSSRGETPPSYRTSAAPRFALTGAAGFVAPRHMKAIHDCGGTLVAALDPHDAAGALDRYALDVAFFRDDSAFEQCLTVERERGQPVDFISICSPNAIHSAHIRLALRVGAHAICEKPLVKDAAEVAELSALSRKAARHIFPILQLREHDAIVHLKARAEEPSPLHEVELRYITARGPWYRSSWKGDDARSGGLLLNIGVHFLDLLLWLFGPARKAVVHTRTEDTVAGELWLERAHVTWLLSIAATELPESAKSARISTHRSLRIDGAEWDLSCGFESLHTRVYERILAGNGWLAEDAEAAITLCQSLQATPLVGRPGLIAHSVLVT